MAHHTVSSDLRARAIAFYLPQFHPIPENDAWWGKGFTEWTNTARARPLFPGHRQPNIPADLGFYDLRVPETRQAQATLARRHGVEAFCYYHYWFAGRRILQRPFDEVLASGAPDFPFCLCWANESWTGVWHGAPDRILIEQTYPGRHDHAAHFAVLQPAFADRRYLRVDGKPLFLLYKPEQLPDPAATLALWRAMAAEAGLGGLHIAGITTRAGWDPRPHGFDAKIVPPLIVTRPWVSRRHPLAWARARYEQWRRWPTMISYRAVVEAQMSRPVPEYEAYPCLVHAWDNTPRAGRNGVVFTGASPALFGRLLDGAVRVLRDKPPERRLLFLKSWNEWAEGNYLEPDLALGDGYLRAVAASLGVVPAPDG
jgi:lipopolysaccharide biosynthesis protein